MAADDFTEVGKASDDIANVSVSISGNTITITLLKRDGTTIQGSAQLPSS